MAEIYNLIKAKNISTWKQPFDRRVEIACTKYADDLGNFCENGSDLINNDGTFYNMNGMKFSFDFICSDNVSSSFMLRQCKCGKTKFACLDEANTCIKAIQICDGYSNCRNGIDENNCMGRFILDTSLIGFALKRWKS